MIRMFSLATAFNQPLNTDGNKWNVSSVTDMNSMFYEASSFNGDISDWNVSGLKNMNRMFYESIINK